MGKWPIALCAVLALGTLAGCGDDDDEAGGASGSASAAGAGDDTGFCAEYTELLAGDPGPDEIRGLIPLAPEAAKEPLENLAAGFEENDAFFETPEFGENFGALGSAAADECATETIEVSAVDYGYEGMPAAVSPGTLAVTFTNDGEELHEMIVFRKKDDTSQSWDELFELEESEVEDLVEEKGAAFAVPGDTSSGLFTLDQAGEYIGVCFIPVGTTPDAEEEVDGPPHFTRGMRVEFTVQ